MKNAEGSTDIKTNKKNTIYLHISDFFFIFVVVACVLVGGGGGEGRGGLSSSSDQNP